MYPEESIKLPPIRTAPKGSFPFAMRNGGELTNYYGMPSRYSDIDIPTTLTLRRGYYACISYVDALVGKLLNQLEHLGLRDNTIVVLWGDHGYKIGDYGSWCKWSNMSIDTRVPLIFSLPEGQRGAVHGEPVEALDIYPTLVEACGFEIPDHVEGESLLETLDKPQLATGRRAFTIWPDQRGRYKKTIMGYSVKDGRFNYTEWIVLHSGELLGKELYDQNNDPKETVNVIDQPDYTSVVSEFSEALHSMIAATDHIFRNKQ